MHLAYALILLSLTASAAPAEEVSGILEIVDGDTVYVASRKIRLSGIDSPETDQTCLNADGRLSKCGLESKRRLDGRFGGKQLTCKLTGGDKYGRALGDCFHSGESMSRWMVRSGWALAFRRYSSEFVADEDYARQLKAGLWAGAFIAPWDWRHRTGRTIILGAVQVPRNAQRELLSPTVAATPPDSTCVIKANMSRNGECIYHVPGGEFYDKLRMDIPGPRRWFCNPAEAEAAGCRKSKR